MRTTPMSQHGFIVLHDETESSGFSALADLNARESGSSATDFLEQVANSLGRILDVGLLQQHGFLVEGVETTLDDLRGNLLDHSFRLALALKFLGSLFGGHAGLGLQNVSRDILAGKPLGAHCATAAPALSVAIIATMLGGISADFL